MTQSCATCRFFSPTDRNDFGHCRRRAPRVGRETGWHEMFPNVTGKDWCGEHEPKGPDQASLPFAAEEVVEATFFHEFGLSGSSRLDVTLRDARIVTFDGPEAVRLARIVCFEMTGKRLA